MTLPALARLGLEAAEEADLAEHALDGLKAAHAAWGAVARRARSAAHGEHARAELFAASSAADRAEAELRRALVVHGSLLGPESFPALWGVAEAAGDALRAGESAREALAALEAGENGDDVSATLAEDVAAGLQRAWAFGGEPRGELGRALAEDLDALAERCAASLDELLARAGAVDVRRALVCTAARRASEHGARFVRRWAGAR